MNDTQFLSELKRRLISKNVDADSADKYAEQFKRYFDNLPDDEIEEQVLSLGNMDSIVDNLVSLINAKKARSAQSGQIEKAGTEIENSGREKTDYSEAAAKGSGEAEEAESEVKDESKDAAESESKYEAENGAVSKSEVESKVESEGKADRKASFEEEAILTENCESPETASDLSGLKDTAESAYADSETGEGKSGSADGDAKTDMSPELPDESDIFCGDVKNLEQNGGGDCCDPEKELTLLQGGASIRKNVADNVTDDENAAVTRDGVVRGDAAVLGGFAVQGNAADHGDAAGRENVPVRRNVPARSRRQRRSYGYYDSEGFSREAYNAAYLDSNSEAEFVISSEAPTAEASLYMRRERIPVSERGFYDYGYEPEEKAPGIRRYIYPQTRRVWSPLTSEAGKSRFRKIGICSLPLVLIAAAAGITLFAAAFAILAAAIVAMLALLILVTVVGTAYSLISIVYGITQLFSAAPIGLYEIGIGIASVGLTLIAGIAVYNAAVRYMPYSIKYLLLFFTYVIDRVKGIVYDFREECANLK